MALWGAIGSAISAGLSAASKYASSSSNKSSSSGSSKSSGSSSGWTSSGGGSSSPSSSPSYSSGTNLRDAAKSLGATVGYDSKTGNVTVSGNGKTISFGSGGGSQYGLGGLSGGTNTISDFSKFASALGYTPVRSAAESQGFGVKYNPSDRSVSLTDQYGNSNRLDSSQMITGNDGRNYMKMSDYDLMNQEYEAYKNALGANPMQQQQNPQAMYEQIYAEIMKNMQPQLDEYGRLQQQALEQSQQQAQQWADYQYRQIDDARQNAQNEAAKQQRAIETGLADANQALDDKYFQQWLAARQQMTNRGMAGSGLASDQDTRLLLSKQRDLAGIYRDAQAQGYNVSDSLAQAQRQLDTQMAGIDPAAKQAEIYNALAASLPKDTSAEKIQALTGLLKDVMPYERATIKDIMENQLGKDKLGFDYDKLASDYAISYMNDLTKRYGIDTDAALRQQLGLWDYNLGQERNQIGWQNAETSRMNAYTNIEKLNRQVAMDEQNINLAYAKLGDSRTKTTLSTLGGQLNNATSVLNRALQSGDAGMIQAATASYNSIRDQINSVIAPTGQTLPQSTVDAGINIFDPNFLRP